MTMAGNANAVVYNDPPSDRGAVSDAATPSAAVTTALDADAALVKAMSQRHVMPLTEYVAERLSGVDYSHHARMQKFGSTLLPIPVPLFKGEAEEEYEQAFTASLSEDQWERRDLWRMRDWRFQFARLRASWYARTGGQAAHVVEVNDLGNGGLDKLPRAALCAVKYVKQKQYKQQHLKGFFRDLKTMSPTEIYNRYGTAVPPVYMPLVGKETPAQCEERFAVWLRETKNLTLDVPISDQSPAEERRCRIEFAASSIDQEETDKENLAVEQSAETGVVMDSTAVAATTTGDPPATDPFHRHRVLPLIEFAAEVEGAWKLSSWKRLQKYGSVVELIPVPLFAGETEEEYEQAYLAMISDAQRKKSDPTMQNTLTRNWRFHFARERARWCRPIVVEGDRSAGKQNNYDLQASRGNVYYVRKVSYAIQVHSGFFGRLKSMSRVEINELFGIDLPPVYMPRREGEKPQQCEERFEEWLRAHKNMTLKELLDHEDPLQERNCRIEFAKATGMADNEKKRKHTEPVTNTADAGSLVHKKKSKIHSPSACAKRTNSLSECPGKTSTTDCTECGCAGGVKASATAFKFSGVSTLARRNLACDDPVFVSPTSAGTSGTVAMVRAIGHNTKSKINDLETKLLSDYDAINQQVVMNEKVLEDLEAQLVSASVTDVRETALVLEENEEFRRLIEDEIDKRNASLALLIMCLWRNDLDELKMIVSDPSATNVPYIHRASHRQSAEVSAVMKEKQTRITKLMGQLNTVLVADTSVSKADVQELKTQLAATNGELGQATSPVAS